MQFFSYTTETPTAPGMTDYRAGGDGKSIDRDLKTLRGVRNRLRKAWPGRSFKVFTFTNIFDDSTFKLVHIEQA